MLSVGLDGSKNTRLLKQGNAGKLVEYVELSCVAKPCGRSSRSMTLIVPPRFGPWAGAMSAKIRASDAATATTRKQRTTRERPITLSFHTGPKARTNHGSRDGEPAGDSEINVWVAENITEAGGADNSSGCRFG